MGKVEVRNQTLRLAWCPFPAYLTASQPWDGPITGRFAARAQPSASSHELASCPAQPGSAHQPSHLLPAAVSSTGQPAPGYLLKLGP